MKKTITKYGVVLKPLTKDKIELVRRWRNDPKISIFMEYRDYITPDMQLKWFHSVDNNQNFYFLIEVDQKEIGLINVRDVDYQQGTGEPGIFIWDDDYLNSTVSFQSILALTDFCFEELNLKKLIIHVLSDNKRAKDFNMSYGYQLSSNQEKIYNQEYTLVYERYQMKRAKILKLLKWK